MGKPRSWQKPQKTVEEKPITGAEQDRANRGGMRANRLGMTRHGEFTVVVTQLVAYALFFGIVYSVGVGTVGGIIAAGLLGASACMVMIVGWPFAGDAQTSLFGRVLAALVFLASAVFVLQGDFYSDNTFIRWAIFMVIAFLVVVVVSFVRQMLRKDRSHLIVSLSTGLTASVAALGSACWIFLPALMGKMMSKEADSAVGWAVFVVLVVVAVLLLFASTAWWRELENPAPFSWMGMGVLPVAFFGFLVFIAALTVHWLL